MKRMMNVAHDTKEVRSVLYALFACLLLTSLFPMSVLAQDHPTEYNWGEITLAVGERKTIYIGSDFNYALNAPVYTNFWNSSNESCVKIVGSNQLQGYCTIEGVSSTSNTKITCQLSYKTSSDSYQWSVWHGYYTVKVTSTPIPDQPQPTPTAISLNKYEGKMVFVGQEYSFDVNYTPVYAAEVNKTWSIDDPTIATITGKYHYTEGPGSNADGSSSTKKIDREGVYVKGVKSGETVIRVKTDEGLTASCKIRVLDKIVFKAQTPEGVNMNFMVIDEEKKTCGVYSPNTGDGVSERAINPSTTGSITIPSQVNGYTVTEICECAFMDCRSLTSITIPNTVTYIGRKAISYCYMKYVNIPNSVTEIADAAFIGNIYIESIEFPNSVMKIGNHMLGNNVRLKKVKLPDSMTEIGDKFFATCHALTSVEIPKNVTGIGKKAFGYCESMTSIEFPEGITSIGKDAFLNCKALQSVVSNIKNPFYIDETTFKDIKSGATLYVPRNTKAKYEAYTGWTKYFSNIVEIDTFGDGDIFTEDVNGVKMQFRIVSSLENTCEVYGDMSSPAIDVSTRGHVTIPEQAKGFTVVGISGEAFTDCEGMTSISFPNTLTYIDCSFSGTSLTNVTIPQNVLHIGEGCFAYCPSLASIKVENGNPCYDSRENCNAIIHTSTNEIVSGCQNSFIPASVKSIGSDAFNGHYTLKAIEIPDGVTKIGDCAFYAVGITTITIPKSVSSIGYSAFFFCEDLKEVYSLIENPFEIYEDVFSIISENAVLYVPRGTKSKYQQTAGWPDNFAKIVEIGDSEYQDGDFFTSIVNGVKMTFQVISAEEKTCEVGRGFDRYDAENNTTYYFVAINSNTKGDITIPSQVEGFDVVRINEGAFVVCTGITSINIPNSVTSIGPYAFYGCESLISINIPDGVINIERSSFYGCSSLTSLSIPNSVTTIGDYAINRCSSLTSIIIPNSVTSIGKWAFYGCI